METLLKSTKTIVEQQDISKRIYQFLGVLLKQQTLLNAGIDTTDYLDDDYDDLAEITDSPYIVVAGGAARDWYMGNPARDVDMYLLIKDFSQFHMNNFGRWPNKVYQHPDLVREYFVTDDAQLDNRSPLVRWIGDALMEQGFNVTRIKDKSYSKENEYRDNNYMMAVVEMEVEGQEFDLIFFDGNRNGVIIVKENGKNPVVEFNATINKMVLSDTAKLSFGDFVVSTFDFNICKAYYDFNAEMIIPCDYFVQDVDNKTLTIVQGVASGSLKHGIFKHYPKLIKKFPDHAFNPITLTGN